MEELRSELRVPLPDLLRWHQGDGKPPAEVLLRLIELLIQQTRNPRQTRPL
jgi:hypothetical protein